MLPEKIIVVKPVFTFIQNPKSKENLKFLLLLSVFLFFIISPGAAASSSWELSPENPTVGDTITVKGTGFEGETAKVMVTFEKEVQVEDGNYEYLLEDVEIPSGNDNSFTVKATGADNLNVRAKALLWITKTGEAKDGVATVSKINVPGGTYKIRIDGKASGSSVKLKITAMQEIELDSGGSFNYEYNTKSIPAGDFEVKAGGITERVELQSADGLMEQNSSEGENNESLEDTVQKEVKKSSGNSHRTGLKLSSESSTVDNTSSMKNKDFSLMGIKSILEAPKAFLFEDLKPYIQGNALTEIIRNPPKIPSFLLGFAGTLLIGLAILRKKR